MFVTNSLSTGNRIVCESNELVTDDVAIGHVTPKDPGYDPIRLNLCGIDAWFKLTVYRKPYNLYCG